jgi:hypothetical protein
MCLRSRIVLPTFLLFSIAMLPGCGGSSNHAVAPPSGAFSNANLKGTYVFSIVGSDNLSNFIAITGAFTADGVGGKGGITGGTIDINDAGGTPIPNSPITGGTYNVSVDGRGQATLVTATPFGNTLKVDFVLSSSSRGLITEFDGVGSGSGSLELQSAAAQPAAGKYVFGLSGISGVGISGGGIPAAAAGAITLDASGNASGSFDFNDNETASLLTLTSGSSVLAGTSPGTATLVTSSGTLNFNVYPIDATHMKLIETDLSPILVGDLFTQSSAALPSGQIVFTMAGFDYQNAVPLVVGGFMTSDGTSTIAGGNEDFDDGGTFNTTPLAFTGNIVASSGRYELQVSNFENGQNGVEGTFTFAAYPSDGGIQLVEIDGNGVTSGIGFAQSSTAIASTEGYGMNLTASNVNSAEDDIAEFTTSATGFSGLIDINDQGQLSFAQKLTGTYSPDSPATGRGIVNASPYFSGVYYTVDDSNVLFLETDQSQLGIGTFQLQNANAKANLAMSHLATLRVTALAARKKRSTGR